MPVNSTIRCNDTNIVQIGRIIRNVVWSQVSNIFHFPQTDVMSLMKIAYISWKDYRHSNKELKNHWLSHNHKFCARPQIFCTISLFQPASLLQKIGLIKLWQILHTLICTFPKLRKLLCKKYKRISYFFTSHSLESP